MPFDERIDYFCGLRAIKKGLNKACREGVLEEKKIPNVCRQDNPHHRHIYHPVKEDQSILVTTRPGMYVGHDISLRDVTAISLGHPCGIFQIFFKGSEFKLFGANGVTDLQVHK